MRNVFVERGIRQGATFAGSIGGMKRTKTNAFDWATIHWARFREENASVEEPTLEPEKNKNGRLVDPLAFLCVRAEKILSDSGVSSKRLRERVLGVWTISLILVVGLGAFVFSFARADRLLSDGGVNLAGPFVFFLFGQIFFLTASLVFVAISLFQTIVRKLRGKKRPLSFAERAVERLSGVVGWLALAGVRRGVRFFYASFGEPSNALFAWKKHAKERRDVAKTPDLTANVVENGRKKTIDKKTAGAFWDFVFSKPRFLLFWGSVLSHLFWASSSICVLLILVVRMQGERYDYCWRTSLEDERVVKKFVDFLGAPIERLGVEVPTEEEVERLFEERDVVAAFDVYSKAGWANAKNAPTHRRRMEAQTRACWSRFLLSVVFVWCVAPRCFLVGVYYFLLRGSLRDFCPDLNEPFFRRIIEREETYLSTTVSKIVVDAEEDAEQIATSESKIADESLRVASEKAIIAETAQIKERAQTGDAEFAQNTTFAQEDSKPIETSNVAEKEKTVANTELSLKLELDSAFESSFESSLKSSVAQVDAGSEERQETRIETEIGQKSGDSSEIAAKSERILLALGYDAAFSTERWNDLFDAEREPVIFGDVAKDFEVKNDFRRWIRVNGSTVDVCVVLTDVSLPPARHCVKFFRDDLGPALPTTRIFVVLSGGEKLRRKFGATAATAVGERIDDWKNAFAELSRGRVVPMEPVFFFDADLDLPAPRERLRRLLSGAAIGELAPTNGTPRRLGFEKWNAAIERIVAESDAFFTEQTVESARLAEIAETSEILKTAEISQSPQSSPSIESAADAARDERDRRRVASICSEIFAIYREEIAEATALGVAEISCGDWSAGPLLARFSELGASGLCGAQSVGETLANFAEKSGLDASTLEKKLTEALGLSAKMRRFCGKLSPRCALVAASVGVSIPVVATFAPLIGGAVSASALAATLGSLGTLLPSALASGATGAALGSIAPTSFAACKRKLVEKWNASRRSRTPKLPVFSENPETLNLSSLSETPILSDALGADAESERVFSVETVESVAAFVCAATTWTVALELQGRPEDEIVAALPIATRPLETSLFESPQVVRETLDAVGVEVRKLRKLES